MEIKECICKYSNTRIWHKEEEEYYYHREDGPAVIFSDNKEAWYYYDIPYLPMHMPLNLFLSYVKWEYKKLNGN